jgi:hypothetical protein
MNYIIAMYFRPFQNGGKRTLYLVDTVAMVAQQASYIRHLTDLSVGEYTSSDTVNVFEVEDWEQELQENQVFFQEHRMVYTLDNFIMILTETRTITFLLSINNISFHLIHCRNKHSLVVSVW